MELSFSEVFLKVLEFSRDEAVRTGWHNIGVEHIMLGILRQADNEACRALEAAGVRPGDVKGRIDDAVFVGDEQVPWAERERILLCDSACSMMQRAALEMKRCHDSELTPLHFLLAVCRSGGNRCSDILSDMGVSLEKLLDATVGRERYGLATEAPEPPAIDANLLAAAIEARLRRGYGTDDLAS